MLVIINSLWSGHTHTDFLDKDNETRCMSGLKQFAIASSLVLKLSLGRELMGF